MQRGNHQTMLGKAGCCLLLFALVDVTAVSVAVAAEPLRLEAIKSRLREGRKKIDSLYVRVRRETRISVEPGVLRGWSRQMSLPKYLGWDEVLFGFKGERRYWRLLCLDYKPTLPTGLPRTEVNIDEAKAWDTKALLERRMDFKSHHFFYRSQSLAEARDSLPPPEYLMNVGLAVPDPTGRDEAKRNLQQMGLLPELFKRWPYVVSEKTEDVDGAPCVVLKGKMQCQLPAGEASENKSVSDKLWLDMDHGLALRKRETRKDGQLRRVLNSDFQEILPGFWLPKRSQTQTFAPPNAAEQNRNRPVMTSDMKLCLFLVNQIPDELFDLVLTQPGE